MTQKKKKAALRKHFLANRNGISKTACRSRSRAVEKHVLDFIKKNKFHDVFGYMAYGSEVLTVHLLKKLRRLFRIYVPKVNARRKQLDFYEVKNFLRYFKKSAYGILEPSGRVGDKFKPGLGDVVLVPGIVFDQNGHRLGYGKGYYDRFLKKAPPGAVTIGLSYHSLFVEELPTEPHDARVQFVATEKGIFKTATTRRKQNHARRNNHTRRAA